MMLCFGGRAFPLHSILAMLAAALPAAGMEPTSASIVDKDLKPLVQKHCAGCHGGTMPKGKLRLDGPIDPATISISQRKLWNSVLQQVKGRTMPPRSSPQPDDTDFARLESGLQAVLDDCSIVGTRAQSSTALRRLNRRQYRNTVRDLFGIDLDPTVEMPADEVGHGFDNIADVLRVSPTLLDHYLRMGDEVARAVVIIDPVTVAPIVARLEWPPQRFAGKGAASYSGEKLLKPLDFDFEAPAADDYVLRIQHVAINGGAEPFVLLIHHDGREVGRLPTDATSFAWHHQSLRLPAGKVKLTFSMVDPGLPKLNAGNTAGITDRVILIERVLVARPSRLKAEDYPEAHRRVLIARPSGNLSPRDAAKTILTPLANRAYRRPASAQQVERLLKVVEESHRAGDSFERGIQLAIQAMLCSPNFLFLTEQNGAQAKEGRLLNDYELASRLSYFLWNTMPDEPLLEAAARQQLRADLDAQVDRMIADRRFESFAESFATQWLELHKLANFNPDSKGSEFLRDPESLKRSMVRETVLHFAAVFRENRPLPELLDSDFTYLDRALAAIYNAPGNFKAPVPGMEPEFQRVASRGFKRGGILTQASVLAATSYSTRTSPVIRGAWILENLLGTPSPPPPPDIPGLEEAARDATGPVSLRKQLEKHRANAQCAVCHNRIDPLGLALENYNYFGAFRTQDEHKLPIDASAQLLGGEPFTGVDGLKKLLLGPKKQEFLHCFTSKMLTYALGREVEETGHCQVKDLVAVIGKDEYRAATLLKTIIRSDAFQKR